MKQILGIIGPLATGKNTAADYASSRLNAPIYQISSELKRIAQERGSSLDRQSLIQISRELAVQYEDDYLAKLILESCKDDLSILAGMRQVGQINYLRENSDFILVGIDANPVVRFVRARVRNKSGDPLTFEEFLQIEREEDGASVQQISLCMKQADYFITNESSIESLYVGMERILRDEFL